MPNRFKSNNITIYIEVFTGLPNLHATAHCEIAAVFIVGFNLAWNLKKGFVYLENAQNTHEKKNSMLYLIHLCDFSISQ